jgi:mono/diheme cytochrome c family protein
MAGAGSGQGGAPSGAAGSLDGAAGSTAEPEGLLAFGPPGVPVEEMCGYCHGVNGEGTNLGPELQHPVEDYSTWVIRNGRMGHPDYEDDMPAYGQDVLTDELLQEIFVFLQDFPEAADGEGLYLDHCANCHGSDGLGGVTMRDVTPESTPGVITHVRDGAHPGEFDNRTEYMHAYTTGDLTDAQVQLIAEYVQTL